MSVPYRSRHLGHYHRLHASTRINPLFSSSSSAENGRSNSQGKAGSRNDPTSTSKFGDSGMSLLICIHQLMGISYFGVSAPSSPQSLLLRLLFIIWNFSCFTFSAYTFYISTCDEVKASKEEEPEGKQVDANFLGQKAFSPLVNYIRYASLVVYFLFSYFLSFYMGFVARPLIRLMTTDILPLLPPKVEHRIGVRIAVGQAVIIALQTTIFQILLYSNFGAILWVRWIENILNLYSLSSTITAIAYINFSIAKVIQTVGNQRNLSAYIKLLQKLKPIIDRVTHLLWPAIFIVITNATISTISALSLFVIDYKSTYYISIIGFLDYSILMVSLVLVSSYAYEKAKLITAIFKDQLTISTCSALDLAVYPQSSLRTSERIGVALLMDSNLTCSLLMILTDLQNSLQISPFGLFTLRRSYITIFFSFMLTYSVILIQTSTGP